VYHQGSASFMASKEARTLLKLNKKLLKSKHKDARFEHTRIGNLEVLREYQRIKSVGFWSVQLEQRRMLRFDALLGDAPRSWWKSWIWKKRIAGIS
jgi:hypothetical protein